MDRVRVRVRIKIRNSMRVGVMNRARVSVAVLLG